MFTKKNNLVITTEANKAGDIKLLLSDLANFNTRNEKLRMFSLAKLKPGEEVDFHVHEGECEYYYIISGDAVYDDNGVVMPLEPGDVSYTPSGTGHGIKNAGNTMLEFIALIIAD